MTARRPRKHRATRDAGARNRLKTGDHITTLTPTPISRAPSSTDALSDGNNRATALSLNVCP